MDSDSFEESMQQFSKEAGHLKFMSGNIDMILGDIEEKLRAEFEFGAWVPISIDKESDKTCKIGWAEVDGEWRLAYRTQEIRCGRDKDTQAEYTSTTISRGALRNAPRPIRIQAMRQIEPLIRKLSTVADQHCGPISEALYWSVMRYRKIEDPES